MSKEKTPENHNDSITHLDSQSTSSQGNSSQVKAPKTLPQEEWVLPFREALQNGSDEDVRNHLLSLRRTLDLERKRLRLSVRTLKAADAFIAHCETYIQDKKAVSALQSRLELYHSPEKRANLDPREMTELRNTVIQLRERLIPFQQLRENILNLFDYFTRSHQQDLQEESSLKSSLQEYMQWVDPRVKGHLETQIRAKSENLPFEPRIAALQSFIQKLMQTSPSILRAEVNRLVHLAQSFLQQKNVDGAIQHLQQAVEYDNRNGEVYTLLMECAQLKKDPKLTLQYAKKAVEAEPERASFRLTLARLCEEQHKVREAILHYQKALEQQPGRFTLLTHLAKYAFEHGRWETALPLLRRVLEEKPASLKTLRRLGIALVRMGELDEGIDLLTQAVRRKDDDAAVHEHLGIAYQGQGRYGEALAAFQEAVRMQPDNPFFLKPLAQVHYDRGGYVEAIEYCRQYLAFAEDVDVRLLLAKSLRKEGESEEATQLLRPLLDRSQNQPEILIEFTEASLKNRQAEEAYTVLKHFVTPGMDHPEFNSLMGKVCIHTGRFQEAMQYMDPGNAA